MALRIRLARGGAKKRPFYHLVVADSRSPRDGRFIERLGTYDPLLERENPKRVTLKEERIKYWLSHGATPSERVERFLGEAGIVPAPPIRERPIKSRPKAKARERAEAAKKPKAPEATAAPETAEAAPETAAEAPQAAAEASESAPEEPEAAPEEPKAAAEAPEAAPDEPQAAPEEPEAAPEEPQAAAEEPAAAEEAPEAESPEAADARDKT